MSFTIDEDQSSPVRITTSPVLEPVSSCIEPPRWWLIVLFGVGSLLVGILGASTILVPGSFRGSAVSPGVWNARLNVSLARLTDVATSFDKHIDSMRAKMLAVRSTSLNAAVLASSTTLEPGIQGTPAVTRCARLSSCQGIGTKELRALDSPAECVNAAVKDSACSASVMWSRENGCQCCLDSRGGAIRLSPSLNWDVYTTGVCPEYETLQKTPASSHLTTPKTFGPSTEAPTYSPTARTHGPSTDAPTGAPTRQIPSSQANSFTEDSSAAEDNGKDTRDTRQVSCDARCQEAGHCCRGLVSGCQHPSCAIGCQLATASKSLEECEKACHTADKQCAVTVLGLTLSLCAVCDDKCGHSTHSDKCGGAADGVGGCMIGCRFALDAEQAVAPIQEPHADTDPPSQASESQSSEPRAANMHRPWLDTYITRKHLAFWRKQQQVRETQRQSILKDNSFNTLRRKYCAKEQALTPSEFRVPQELQAYLNGTAIPKLKGKGKSFNATMVMAHAQKLQSAIVFYQEGLDLDTENNLPLRTSGDVYEAYEKSAVQSLLNSLLQKPDEEYTIGIIGDSGAAGQDNCYYDSWVPTLKRILSPLFSAMGKRLVVRNAARNGGLGASFSLACLDTMLGSDIDALMIAFHGVGFGTSFAKQDDTNAADAAMESTLRRALERQQVVFSDTKSFGQAITERYHKYGVTSGNGRGLQWQPAPRHPEYEPFWGSVGDERCHVMTTRSGSAAVWFRNWHAGPLGHSTRADMYAIRWLDLIIAACAHLASGLTKPGTVLVSQPTLPTPYIANIADIWSKNPAVCITTEGPVFNTRSYGGLKIKWVGTHSSGGNHLCPDPQDIKCVSDVTRSPGQCQHIDSYAKPLQPGSTTIPANPIELWGNVQTIVLCNSRGVIAGSVSLTIGSATITCTRRDFKDQNDEAGTCNYCPVRDMWKGSPQPFKWEGAAIDHIFWT